MFLAVPRPKPLSTVVHKVDKGNPISRAVILSSTLDKVEELRYQLVLLQLWFSDLCFVN